ncbi:tRNA (guanine-N1)-methyltransferase [Winogradskyella sp. DF17]|uniref:tRNA (Guanine-N1)-methyltransferase n=1 Tax=Winogradskyella pelagia TaxID=2819984 RepID=A0ABS3T3K9_9FLAO|nr:tRNA (guanine-N1)-methyltransferase [Winogradskyella sp. DF17]MBO3117328.1 tRNA (guanine-N1)-methyltransferase [Winogradskyella sp. DF17]
MNSALKIGLIIILALNFQFIEAQAKEEKKEDKLSLNSGTIDNQFEYVIQRSNRYQEFKVVKQTWLYALKAHTLDSLKALHKELSDTQAIVDGQASNIETLQTNLANTQTTLEETEEEKNNMMLFGVQMGKTNYNILMWSIIAALLSLLLFFIYKFKNSNALTREAKLKLDEVETEFEEHRRTALEREQKVRRQLQDELNKNKAKS